MQRINLNDYGWEDYGWEEYFMMFDAYLRSSNYAAEFPDFERAMNACGHDDALVIKALLDKGLNAQNGLDSYIDTLIGKRHSMDYLGYGSIDLTETLPIIELFINRGAKMNFCRLFKHYRDDIDYSRLTWTFQVAARLIDLTHHYGLDASMYGNWSEINGRVFGDMDDILDSGFTFEVGARMMLKSFSTYLHNL